MEDELDVADALVEAETDEELPDDDDSAAAELPSSEPTSRPAPNRIRMLPRIGVAGRFEIRSGVDG